MIDASRAAVAVAAAFSLGVTCGSSSAPPPDSCNAPATRALSGLEIGPELLLDRPFESWAAVDTAYVTTGLQGGYMIGVSLRVPGDAPACLAQRTTASAGGRVVAEEDSPLKTYEQVDGTRTTKTMWLVFADRPPLDSQVEVTTVAGGKASTVSLTIAPDRHRLESLTLLTTAPTVGSTIELELRSRHAPAYSSLTPTFLVSNPDIVIVNAPQYVYDEVLKLQGTATAAGETEVIVQLRDQEVRVPIVVTE